MHLVTQIFYNLQKTLGNIRQKTPHRILHGELLMLACVAVDHIKVDVVAIGTRHYYGANTYSLGKGCWV